MSYSIEQLVIYDNLRKDSVLELYQGLIATAKQKKRTSMYYSLVRKLLASGKSFKNYIYSLMLSSNNPVLEKLSHEDYELYDIDYSCLKNDLMVLNHLLHFDVSIIFATIDNQHKLMEQLLEEDDLTEGMRAYQNFFDEINDKPIFHAQCDQFVALLRKYGVGQYATNYAFFVDSRNNLVPIEKYEPLQWSHIYEYTYQKDKLYANTKALIEGRPFHHALLVGASGTGKSSSVKGIVDVFKDEKLRLIQLYKGQLKRLPKLLEAISRSPFKFVIFIDDLSFEVNEDEYKFLKSFIEGGVANEANNVAFYVTSNRRHLIKEIRSEREGDIHLEDFIQEMTSLSSRFGLLLTYEKLVQKDYYEMVYRIATDAGLTYDKEKLLVKAKQWSMRHGGMSGRVANQLIRHLQMTGEEV